MTSVDLEEYAQNHPTNEKPVRDLGASTEHHWQSTEGVKEREKLTQKSIQ